MPDHLLPLMNTEVVADVICVCDSILYKVYVVTNETRLAVNIIMKVYITFAFRCPAELNLNFCLSTVGLMF